MITLKEYPNVKFLNYKDENEVKKFVFGDGVNPAEPLYKYSTWKNAKQSMADRYLWMSNPSVWEDPFEKYFLNAQYEDSAGNLMSFPFKNKVFCNCLTPDHNSEAHWITYAKKNVGVSLRINVQELIERLDCFGIAHSDYRIYIGKVSYRKQSEIQVKSIHKIPLLDSEVKRDIEDADFCANLMLLKRKAFKHDNEVRLILIQDNTNEESKGVEFSYNYDSTGSVIKDYPNENLISRVFTSPFYGVEKRDSIQKELEKKKYGFSRYPVNLNSGKTTYFKSRIQRSRLYDSVKSKILL